MGDRAGDRLEGWLEEPPGMNRRGTTPGQRQPRSQEVWDDADWPDRPRQRMRILGLIPLSATLERFGSSWVSSSARRQRGFETGGLKPTDWEEICRRLGREPNRAELGMFGVMWSEHCCYRNSRPLLSGFPPKGEDSRGSRRKCWCGGPGRRPSTRLQDREPQPPFRR